MGPGAKTRTTRTARARARRTLIQRTARIWSRLTKAFLKDARVTLDNWIKNVLREARSNAASGFIIDIPDVPTKFERLLTQLMLNGMAYGRWLAHMYLQETRGKKPDAELRSKLSQLIDSEIHLSDDDWHEVLPTDTIAWFKNYIPQLSGNIKEGVGEIIRDTLFKAMQEGATLQGRVTALNNALEKVQSLAKSRLETIARTELTRADTMGRLTEYLASNDVEGIEFSAILDDRTTDICSERHGLIMRLDDPRLPENTPPLHPNCRSILLAVTIYDHTSKLRTSDEFDDVPEGIQRPQDIEAVREALSPSELQPSKFNGMSNEEYQAVYVDKILPFEAWQSYHDFYKEADKYQSDIDETQIELDALSSWIGAEKLKTFDFGAGIVSITEWQDYHDRELINSIGQALKTLAATDPIACQSFFDALDKFDMQGKNFFEQQKKLTALSAELNEKKAELDRYFNPNALTSFSDTRKQAAALSKNPADIDARFRPATKQAWLNASKEQRQAVFDYTGAAFNTMNMTLANFKGRYARDKRVRIEIGEPPLPLDYRGKDIKQRILNATAFLESAITQEDITVRHGCGGEAIVSWLHAWNEIPAGGFEKLSEQEMQKYVGKEYVREAFLSTAAAVGRGFFDSVDVEIFIPKGTEAVYAEPFSACSGVGGYNWDPNEKVTSFGQEFEVIVQRGATYKITEIKKISDSNIHIKMELHPECGYNKRA